MANETTNEQALFFVNGNPITLLLISVNLIIFLTGLFAVILNVIVVDTIVRRSNLEGTDLILCSLAVTDMLTGLVTFQVVAYNIFDYDNLQECLVRIGIVFTLLSGSVFHRTLLTVDRFVKIIYPYRYHHVVMRKTVITSLIVVWFFSLNIGLLPSYGWKDIPRTVEEGCTFFGTVTRGYLRLCLGIFFIPLGLIIILYCKIFIVARRHARAIASTDITGTADSSTLKFNRTVTILIAAYIISYLPAVLLMLLDTVGGLGVSDDDAGTLLVYTSVLGFLNPIFNPVIYACKLPVVNDRFKGICCRKSRPCCNSK